METPKKNKGGRPRKEPTFTKGFRFNHSFRNFFSDLENANQFLIDTITNTPEYKAFLAKKQEQEQVNQPSLFKGE